MTIVAVGQGLIEGCYTFTRRPLRLEYAGEFPWIHDAIAFEKKMKGWSHREKRTFAERGMSRHSPQWREWALPLGDASG